LSKIIKIDADAFHDGSFHEENPSFTGCLELSNGHRAWYKDGKAHRVGKPAYTTPDGGEDWNINGQFHRENGPAIIKPDGTKHWLLKGKSYTKEEYDVKMVKYKIRRILDS
jgi:hypothetical protein